MFGYNCSEIFLSQFFKTFSVLILQKCVIYLLYTALKNGCIITLLFTPSLIKIRELSNTSRYLRRCLQIICIYDLVIECQRTNNLLSPKRGQCNWSPPSEQHCRQLKVAVTSPAVRRQGSATPSREPWSDQTPALYVNCLNLKFSWTRPSAYSGSELMLRLWILDIYGHTYVCIGKVSANKVLSER